MDDVTTSTTITSFTTREKVDSSNSSMNTTNIRSHEMKSANSLTPLSDQQDTGTAILCKVCHDKASGFHYGVHSCEGCKGFFRRSIQLKFHYKPCPKSNQCSVFRANRNHCQSCRLKKCLAVGMSRDAVRFGRMPRKEKEKYLAEMDSRNLNLPFKSASHLNGTANSATEDAEFLLQQMKFVQTITNAYLNTCCKNQHSLNKIIEGCILSSGNVGTITKHQASNSSALSESEKQWQIFSDRFSPAIQEVVECAKHIPGYLQLIPKDQMALLKGGCLEVLLIRLCSFFDCKNSLVTLTSGKIYTRQELNKSGIGDVMDVMFDFAEKFQQLNLNDPEKALFVAIVLLSPDRDGITEMEKVNAIQENLKKVLKLVVSENHASQFSTYAKLLMRIPQLKIINCLHAEKLLAFSSKTGPTKPSSKKMFFPKASKSMSSISEAKESRKMNMSQDGSAPRKNFIKDWNQTMGANTGRVNSGNSRSTTLPLMASPRYTMVPTTLSPVNYIGAPAHESPLDLSLPSKRKQEERVEETFTPFKKPLLYQQQQQQQQQMLPIVPKLIPIKNHNDLNGKF